jgi:hypothetical protein
MGKVLQRLREFPNAAAVAREFGLQPGVVRYAAYKYGISLRGWHMPRKFAPSKLSHSPRAVYMRVWRRRKQRAEHVSFASKVV